jgi:hypothetical protein
MKMNEFIEFSNFMLINFWWVILPVCAVVGTILFFATESFFNNETINKTFINSGIKWDKYGNPIIDETE